MHNVGKRVLSMAVFGVVLVGAGCEKMENAGRGGDRKVDAAVTASIGSSDASKGMAELKAAMSDASDAGKARGASELARDEYNMAVALLPEINRQGQAVSGALFDLGQAAAQLNDIQLTAASSAQRDPQEAIGKLDAARADMQKSADQAKADAAGIKAELEKRQKEIDDLKAQRQKADAEAESLADKSNSAKGEESVKLFKQSTDVRTQSGTLAAQIETKTAALIPFQRQLAIAQGQQALWDSTGKEPGALQMVDDRKAQIAAEWQGTQQQSQALSALAKKLATEVITPGGGDHPNAGGRLAAALKAGDKARGDAQKLLQSAAQHADDAAKAAKAMKQSLSTRLQELTAKSPSSAEAASIQALQSAFDENQYLLQKGNILVALANINADETTLNMQVKQTMDALTQALQASGQTASTGITVPDPAAAKASAEKAYKDAEAALESVVNAKGNFEGKQAITSAGLSSLLMARFGHYQLTLDADTRARLRDDMARAKESSVSLPMSLRGM